MRRAWFTVDAPSETFYRLKFGDVVVAEVHPRGKEFVGSCFLPTLKAAYAVGSRERCEHEVELMVSSWLKRAGLRKE